MEISFCRTTRHAMPTNKLQAKSLTLAGYQDEKCGIFNNLDMEVYLIILLMYLLLKICYTVSCFDVTVFRISKGIMAY